MSNEETTTTTNSSASDNSSDSAVKENEKGSEIEHFENGKQPSENLAGFDLILDIPVSVSMEVGRTSISIRKLLQLTQGSIIELERLAGEPLDVMVNGTLIAHGEVVVVNEKFGIRLTDIMSQAERIQKLK